MRRQHPIHQLKRLAQPGKVTAQWQQRVDRVIGHVIATAWPMKREEMLATDDVVVVTREIAATLGITTEAGEHRLHHLAAWGDTHGPDAKSAVYFLGDGSAVVAHYWPNAIHYRRFVRG